MKRGLIGIARVGKELIFGEDFTVAVRIALCVFPVVNAADPERHLLQGTALLIVIIDTFRLECIAGLQAVQLRQGVGDYTFVFRRGESALGKLSLSALERLGLAQILEPAENVLGNAGFRGLLSRALYLYVTGVNRGGVLQLVGNRLHLRAVHGLFQVPGGGKLLD